MCGDGGRGREIGGVFLMAREVKNKNEATRTKKDFVLPSPAVCPGEQSVNVHAQCAWHTVVAVVEGSQRKVGRHPSTTTSAREARRRRRVVNIACARA